METNAQTLKEMAASLHRSPVYISGLQKRFELPMFSSAAYSATYLAFLRGLTAPDFQLLHLPDYDPVGLDEFTRLRERLGPRVQLHVMENLAELFTSHANGELLKKPSTQSFLAKLRLSQIAEVRSILALIEKHNAGLEQEALLIHAC